MADRPIKRKKLIRRLKKHYRLVVMNDDNFEIKASLKLTPLNVLFFVSTLSVIFAIVIISLLLFTPLKQYVIGENREHELRKDLITLSFETDSLQNVVAQQDEYIYNVMAVLRGDVDTTRSAYQKKQPQTDSIPVAVRSDKDSLLRMEMESQESYGILTLNDSRKISSIEEYYFFAPLKGIVTNEFSGKNDHYGVDIVADKNSSVKATLDGKIIFAGWTLDDGYVLAVQHETDLISIYKHNSIILKRVGSQVKAGDVIAIIGDSGELSQGPHLHFELWHNMLPIDPLEYINFK